MQKRAAIYARVSTARQREQGTSLISQVKTGKAYCRDKGYIISKIYQEDISGTLALPDRPQMFEMYLDGKKSEFDLVICYDEDRWSRNTSAGILAIGDFLEIGIDVDIIQGGSTFTPENKLVLEMKTVIAAYIKNKLVREMTKAKYTRTNEGKIMGTHYPPLGYTYNDDLKMLEVDPVTAETVKHIFNRYAGGDISLIKLCDELEQSGHLTSGDLKDTISKRLGRGTWCSASIRKIIKNPVHRGEWIFGKNSRGEFDPVSVEVEPIVSPEIWRKANDRLVENRNNRPSAPLYALKGKLRCSACGSMFRRKVIRKAGTDKQWKYYVCRSATCKTKMIRARDVETAIASWVLNLMSSPEELQKELEIRIQNVTKDNKPTQKKLKLVTAEIAKESKALERMVEGFAYAKLDKKIFQKKTDNIHARIKVLGHRRDDLNAQLEPVPEFDLDVLSEMFLDEQISRHDELLSYVKHHKEPVLAYEKTLHDIYTQIGFSGIVTTEGAELKCSLSSTGGSSILAIYHEQV